MITSAVALDQNTVGNKIQELQNRLQEVTDELHQQVAVRHGALLQQATQADRFDTALNDLSDEVERISGVARRTRAQVESQFKLVHNQTKVQSRLNVTLHILRISGSLLTLSSKLKNTKDLLKQAELHYELGQIINEDLSDIDFIKNERAYVLQSRRKLKNLTQIQLVSGLQERNESQVVHALKISFNLNSLEKSLENLLATIISNLEQSLKECFAGNDISTLNQGSITKINTGTTSTLNRGSLVSVRGPGKTPHLATTQNFRAKFWKSLIYIIYDEVYESCEQICLLRRALEQINKYNYIPTVDPQVLQKRFWHQVQDLFRRSFDECLTHVTQTLQEGLAKLLSSARGLEQRLNNEFLFENDIFESLESGYISKCAGNLKACITGIDLPNNETVDNFIRTASIELSAALIDSRLTKSVEKVFISCAKEFCSKIEAQIKLGTDTRQVVDMPNAQQMQNIALANILFYYKDSVRRMLSDLGEHLSKTQSSVRENIAKSVESANVLISTILQQIMDSIAATISIILLSMHREPGLNSEKTLTVGVSMYVKELQEFIARTWLQHVSPFDDNELTAKCGIELAKRSCELFIHNICILRPLSQTGRQRLQNDCAYMPQALKPMCSNFSDLGKPARLLRAISFLIVQEPKELIHSISKDSLVPSYLILFLLFGWADAELQSPHTTVNWSNERLIEWLSGHTSEHEKLELISGALQRYRDLIRRKNIQKYDEVYPLMVNFFERALKEMS